MSFLGRLKHLALQVFSPEAFLRMKYIAFKELLENDRLSHGFMAALEQSYHADRKVEFNAVGRIYNGLAEAILHMIENLRAMTPHFSGVLSERYRIVDSAVLGFLAPEGGDVSPPYVWMLPEIPVGAERTVGGKASHLASIRNELSLPVPDGFVITSNAFRFFCRYNGLTEEIASKLAALDVETTSSLHATSAFIEGLIRGGSVPPPVEQAMAQAYEQVCSHRQEDLAVSFRSSAVGEDATLSFAGQYRTVLNVTSDQLNGAYKEVLAGKYSPTALYYRVAHGLLDEETAMAVLVTEMIDAASSGVLYSRSPVRGGTESEIIYFVRGLGELLVEGAETPDVIEVTPRGELAILESVRSREESESAWSGEGGTEMKPPAAVGSGRVSLDESSVRELAEWGALLESHFGGPQDVEWCKSKEGQLLLLQSRPLRLENPLQERCKVNLDSISHRILLSAGDTAASGVGAGEVVRVHSQSDLARVAAGSVLVARTLRPEFAQVADKLKAVVTDIGSVAGHFASVAREWGIPTLVNTRIATKTFRSGEMVTVDAGRGVVFSGVVDELIDPSCRRRVVPEESSFHTRLRKILDQVSPLNLLNPGDPSFAPENCKTFHDLLRFMHEKAVDAMFSLGAERRRALGGARKLSTDIPITLYVLDLGDGLRGESVRRKTVAMEDIVNPPLKALWGGLSHPSVHWSNEVRHFDWEELDRISAGIVSFQSQLLSSFALVSADYLNINIRFGYHFVVLDSFCGEELNENSIAFRFEGGGAAYEGRRLRAVFMERVLRNLGFHVHREGDMVESRIKGASFGTVQKQLKAVGRLLGVTRLLDMRLKTEDDVDRLVAEFHSEGRETAE